MALPEDGRKRKVSSGGLGVHKRGDGLGTGPVGRADGYQGRKDAGKGGSGSGGTGGGGPRRSSGGGGKSPMLLIILVAVFLLGGGGGLSGLLGGGGSDSGSGTGSNTGSQTGSNTGSYSGSNTGSQSGSQNSGSLIDTVSQMLGSGSSPYSIFGNSSYSNYDYSDDYTGSGEYQQGTVSGGLMSGLESLLGSGLSSSAAGVSTGWSIETGNTGILNTKVAAGARKKYYNTSKAEDVTIMIYMCGTDLESRSKMATMDLTEMAKASISDNVNIIVYTGGCRQWQNDIISSSRNQVYQVKNGGLKKLVDDDGTRSMTDPTTLSRFIQWCGQEFPADRNELILWDHGGGSVSGYGYDEKNARAGSMDLAQIHKALEQGGMKFDFIGFDACLMATAENAISLADYADYLLASEETEPGTGWYYTDWVTELSRNPAMSTPQLGKLIIDDFVDVSAKTCRGQSTTLSLVDLAELSATFPEVFKDFAKATSDQIKGTDFKRVSTARNGGREFAQSSKIDQVDLTDMAIRMGTSEAKTLCDTVLSAVKYNRTSTDMTNAYGLSIYFPKQKLSQVDSMVNTYKQLGLDTDFAKVIQQYATVQASGQSVSGGLQTPWSTLSGGGAQSSWQSSSQTQSQGGSMTSSLMMEILEQMLSSRAIVGSDESDGTYEFITESGLTSEELTGILIQNQLDGSLLTFVEEKQDDGSVAHKLSLPKDQWEMIDSLQVNIFYDDGEGYVDLGLDLGMNTPDENGVLVGDTDGAWISINKQPVAIYYEGTTLQENGGYQATGRVPCLLNGQRANLILVFDTEHPDGYVAGARFDYVKGETNTVAKALTEIEEGDTIDFVCDYYSYEGEYQDSYYLGEQQTVSGDLEVSYTEVADGNCLVTYMLTDMYGQEYWTNAIKE